MGTEEKGRRLIDFVPIHFLLGPGGSGVTTTAVALAVNSKQLSAGSRPKNQPTTLVISLDKFGSAAQVFGVYSAPGDIVQVSTTAALLELDPLQLMGNMWNSFLAGISNSGGAAAAGGNFSTIVSEVFDIDGDELLGIPGVLGVLWLQTIFKHATEGRFDRIIVDVSGGVDVFELLQAPELFSNYLERFWPRHRRLTAAIKSVKLAKVVAVVDSLATICLDLTELLNSGESAFFHLVDDPGRRRLTEQFSAVLGLLQFPLVSVLTRDPELENNRPNWLADELPIQLIGELVSAAPAPTVIELRKLALALDDSANGQLSVTGYRAAEVTASGVGLASRFELTWQQHIPDPARLILGRSGDDILITVSGVRKGLRLPSALRRCTVVDASWSAGKITVAFEPNPEVWPHD